MKQFIKNLFHINYRYSIFMKDNINNQEVLLHSYFTKYIAIKDAIILNNFIVRSGNKVEIIIKSIKNNNLIKF